MVRTIIEMMETLSGDISYELSSIKERFTESFSLGSTVSGDSSVPSNTVSNGDESKSCDPYLDGDLSGSGSGSRLTGKTRQAQERSDTPATLPSSTAVHLDYSDSFSSSTEEQNVTTKRSMVKIEIPKQHATRHGSTIANRSKTSPEILKAQHERNYWNMIVSSRIRAYSAMHASTAEALMQLGHAHARCNEPNEALTIYKSAVRIFRHEYGEEDLRVACALNKLGLVACRFPENKESLKVAMQALKQAFAIRHATLGPHHVDTVDTLNNIAGVYLHVQNYKLASKAYYEVWVVRQGLLGHYHPSVGVAAHALANVNMLIPNLPVASKYFRIAHDIFRRNRLGPDNPTMMRLQADLNRLERIMTLHNALEV